MRDAPDVSLAENHFRRFLLALGLDPEKDEHLRDTPVRFTRLICESTENYRQEPKFVTDSRYDPTKEIKATLFKSRGTDSLVIEGNIPFSSICAHHFSPFLGHAHFGYLPGKSVIGISKFARVLDFYCKRPQTQEFLTEEVHEALWKLLKPRFLAVVLEAEHTCISCRGPRKLGATTITSKFQPHDFVTAKEEFLRLALRAS